MTWAAGMWDFRSHATFSALSRSGHAEEVTSLTGRTELWQYTLHKIQQAPIVGYGYGCPRFILSDRRGWQTFNAHNTILNVALALGWVGAALLSTALLGMVWQMFRRPNTFADVLLIVVLVGGLADVTLLNPMPGALTTMWLFALFWRVNDDLRRPADARLAPGGTT